MKTKKLQTPDNGELWMKGDDYFVCIRRVLHPLRLTSLVEGITAIRSVIEYLESQNHTRIPAITVIDGHDCWKFVANDWKLYIKIQIGDKLTKIENETADLRRRLNELFNICNLEA